MLSLLGMVTLVRMTSKLSKLKLIKEEKNERNINLILSSFGFDIKRLTNSQLTIPLVS